MTDPKCPFTTLQAAGLAACTLADQVVRRGGAEYDCTRPDAHRRCTALATHLLALGLPALGHTDDLTATPKSAYDRALMGGLAGVNRAIEGVDDDLHRRDIRALVEASAEDPASLPDATLLAAIEGYEPPRRRGRRR
jgi:hypothetical protein